MAAAQQTPAQGSSTAYNPALINAITQPGYLQGYAGYQAPTASYDPSQFHGSAHYNNAQINQLSPQLLQALSPGATIGQLQQSMVPQTQQAYSQLNQQLADFGVQGGQGIMAGEQLGGQLAGSIAPAMAQAIQNAQGNELGAGQFDVGQANQMGLANAQNKFGQQEFNVGNRLQQSEFNSQNALQAALANAGFAQNAGQFNATAANQMNQYNTGEQNQYNENLLNAILGNYNQQFGAQMGLIGGEQNALNQQGLNYGQEVTQNPGLLGMFGGIAGAALPFFTGGFGGGGGGGGMGPLPDSLTPSGYGGMP